MPLGVVSDLLSLGGEVCRSLVHLYVLVFILLSHTNGNWVCVESPNTGSASLATDGSLRATVVVDNNGFSKQYFLALGMSQALDAK